MNEYLIIYDVRGIQNYIFKTNKIKEITGASIIVKDKLPALLEELLSKDNKYVSDWKNQQFKFLKDSSILAEIVYVGGGNLLLAFRGDEESLKEFNDKLQKRFLEETYSLSLAYATVKMTKDFKSDLSNVKKLLKNVKKRMPQLVMSPACPIVEIDQYTSDVLSCEIYDNKISMESYLKLNAYKNAPMDRGIKFIDSIAGKDERNENSKTMIGIVHIDGNNLGEMISKFYEGRIITSYEEAVKLSREVSLTIEEAFNDVVCDALGDIDYRIVINSGDDITFICKAEYALVASQKVINQIETKKLGNINFSACGGIVFVHSHFPFFRAYEMAEECCSIAKKRAKLPQNMVNGRATSFIDYEICDAGILLDIATLRSMHQDLYLKPYAVSKTLPKNEMHIESFLDKIQALQKVSRTTVKQLRNIYQLGYEHTCVYYEKIKSRINLFNHYDCYINNVATLYDACSMIDLVKLNNKEECSNDL